MKKLFIIAVSLLISTMAFAELPHTFKNGDILTADMLNKNLQFLEDNDEEKYYTVRANGKIIGKGYPYYSLREMKVRFRNGYHAAAISPKGEIGHGAVHFSSENCTGTPYIVKTQLVGDESTDDLFLFLPFKGELMGHNAAGVKKLYYYPPKAQLYKSTVRSSWANYNQTCTNEVKSNQIVIKLLPNDPTVTGVETYPIPTPITIDGYTTPIIEE